MFLRSKLIRVIAHKLASIAIFADVDYLPTNSYLSGFMFQADIIFVVIGSAPHLLPIWNREERGRMEGGQREQNRIKTVDQKV